MKIKLMNSGAMPLKIVWMGQQEDISLHDHPFYELVVVFDGEGIHVCGLEEYRIGAGDIFLLKPGIAHGYRQTENLELVNILYQPENLNLNLYDLGTLPGYHAFFEFEPAMRRQHGFSGRMRLNGEYLDALHHLVVQLRDELKNIGNGGLFSGVAYLMQIFIFISRNYSGMKNPVQMDLLRLGATLAYIRAHCTRPLTLEDISRKAAMSQSTLYRVFMKAVGMSPVNYVISQRLALAKQLLADSDEEISSIAQQSGFSDSNYFSRLFHRHAGQTPSDYRRKFRHL